MRKLIIVPILHTQTDMGRLSQKLKEEYITQLGESEWYRHLSQIEDFWNEAREAVFSLQLDWKKVKLYQDGLPICGWELKIAREGAEKGSENHQLLLELIGKGAELIGTESPDLLLQEYRRLKEGQVKTDLDLLHKRDDYIAERINDTLKQNETGILFIGLLHHVESQLADDIEAKRLE